MMNTSDPAGKAMTTAKATATTRVKAKAERGKRRFMHDDDDDDARAAELWALLGVAFKDAHRIGSELADLLEAGALEFDRRQDHPSGREGVVRDIRGAAWSADVAEGVVMSLCDCGILSRAAELKRERGWAS